MINAWILAALVQISPDPNIAAFEALDAFKSFKECQKVLVQVSAANPDYTFTCMGFIKQGTDI